MKTLRIIGITLLLFSSCVLVSQAQGLRGLKQKLKQEAKQRLDGKAEEIANHLVEGERIVPEGTPCDQSGTVQVTKSSLGNTSYQNTIRQLDLAEEYLDKGKPKFAQRNLDNAKRYMGYVLKKEPKADISALCQRYARIVGRMNDSTSARQEVSEEQTDFQTGTPAQLRIRNQTLETKEEESESGSKQTDLGQLFFFFNKYYYDANMPANPVMFNFFLDDTFLKTAKTFDREAVLKVVSKSEETRAKMIKQRIEDYSNFIDRQKIRSYLMLEIEQQKMTPDKLVQKAKKAKEIAQGLKNIAGSNASMDEVITYADQQIGKTNDKIADILTSDFHREHLNQVVFTKAPFEPGQESSIEINPTFVAGDAIYGTVYLSATIKNAVNDWKIRGSKGGSMRLFVEGEDGQLLDRRFEKWEIENYMTQGICLEPGIDLSQSYVQFIIVPNLKTDLNKDIKYDNITPIQMARGMSHGAERTKMFRVRVEAFGKTTGPMEYKGTFKVDLSKGTGGAAYYQKVESVKMNQLLASEPLPTASFKDAGLEAQLLAEMNAQGYDEQYLKTYLKERWVLVEPLNEAPYRKMKAAFTYRTADGKCGWQMYTFRSHKTGSGGWTKPKKWGGSDIMQRLSCDKL